MIVRNNSINSYSDGCKATRKDGGAPKYDEWESIANRALREAMLCERSRQWKRVLLSYTRLLDTLSEVIPTEDKERPAWLMLLLYECHYHLGVALQRLDQPKKAIEEFNRAIKTVFISRNGRLVPRLRIATCLVTPVLARRAFAFAYSGDANNASQDAEKAILFDSKNPDVYCIRALVFNTFDKTTQAAKDVSKALNLNRNHVCALILQGVINTRICDETLAYCFGTQNRTIPDEHLKVIKLNPDSYHYLTVDNFRHHQILDFYDKFLYSLSVPHTISHLMTTDNSPRTKDAKTKQSEATKLSPDGQKSLHKAFVHNGDVKYSIAPSAAAAAAAAVASKTAKFTYDRHRMPSKRKKSLSERLDAVECDDHMYRRPNYCDHVTPKSSLRRRNTYGTVAAKGNIESPRDQSKFISLESQKVITEGKSNSLNKISLDGNSHQTTPPSIRTPNEIQIFQKVNLSETPRLYYRSWMGDRLPAAEMERKQRIFPPFKV